MLKHARAASNQNYANWGEVFGVPILASAILDRVLHHSSTIILTSSPP
ncbi:MAG: ATP-binding protein [Leptospirales bacterium]